MKYARKKGRTVKACPLGMHTEMEKALVEEGAIKCLPDGRYAIFSQEAVHGGGEVARRGDYIKVDVVDGKRYPYPNSRSYFEANHRHIRGDEYEQLPHTIKVWQAGDGPCEELDFLLSTGRLVLCPEDDAHYFNATLWEAALSAARDAALAFYAVERDGDGAITDISFNFIARRDFERDYTLCPADEVPASSASIPQYRTG